MTTKFIKFAEDLDDLQIMTSKIRVLTQEVTAAKKEFESNPEFATSVTTHAAARASERIQAMAEEQPELFSDVINMKNPTMSLSLVANIRVFLISVLANAHADGKYSVGPSKSNEGKVEYKYVVNINKWVFDKRRIELVAIVEDNNVKTVFFNWKDA